MNRLQIFTHGSLLIMWIITKKTPPTLNQYRYNQIMFFSFII